MTPYDRALLIIGGTITGTAVIIVLFAPWLAPYDPIQRFPEALLNGGFALPGHLFGLDHLFRDLFSRTLHAVRIDLLAVGVILLPAYGGGLLLAWLDTLGLRPFAWLADAMAGLTLALPAFVLIIGLMFLSTGGVVWAPTVVLALYSLPGTRHLFVTLRRRRDADGDALQPAAVATALATDLLRRAAFILLIMESLAFLGLRHESLTLAGMLGHSINFIPVAPAMAVWPAATLIILLMGPQLLALGLESRLPLALRGMDPVLSILGRG